MAIEKKSGSQLPLFHFQAEHFTAAGIDDDRRCLAPAFQCDDPDKGVILDVAAGGDAVGLLDRHCIFGDLDGIPNIHPSWHRYHPPGRWIR